jgi:hypothetical protein
MSKIHKPRNLRFDQQILEAIEVEAHVRGVSFAKLLLQKLDQPLSLIHSSDEAQEILKLQSDKHVFTVTCENK